MDFKIDKELHRLIPVLLPEEFAQLKMSILSEGTVRDPLVVWAKNGTNILIDGHHRWKIIKAHPDLKYHFHKKHFKDRDEVRLWIIDNQKGRRNLPKFSLIELELRKEAILRKHAKQNLRLSQGRGKPFSNSRKVKEVHIDREIAKGAGVSRETVYRVRFLRDNAQKETVDRLRRGLVSINEAYKQVRSDCLRIERKRKYQKGLRDFAKRKITDHQNVLKADFRDFSKIMDDNSVDLIFTDPPYDGESVPLYGDLAKVAARVLKVGGSLITYCGNRYLPDVLTVMSPHLKFYWTLACIHTGGPAHEKHHQNIGVINKWKPILWFVNGKRGDRTTFLEDAIRSQIDKEHHPQGQSLVEAEYIIERLTKPGNLVFDPFCGGWTTSVAAKRLRRLWITCDTEDQAVLTARRRLDALGES